MPGRPPAAHEETPALEEEEDWRRRYRFNLELLNPFMSLITARKKRKERVPERGDKQPWENLNMNRSLPKLS